MDTINTLTVSEKGYFYTLSKVDSTFPEIIVFNKKGDFIKYRDDKKCNASAFKFIDSLNISTSYPIIDTFKLNKFETLLRDLNGNKVSIFNGNSDFYIFIVWTEFTGKLNKDHTDVWERKALKNKNCKISAYKLNLDFQEYWDAAERDKILSIFYKKKN